MSNELINALENRVTTAVDTIEGLRSEVRVLREERTLLEDKLRELLQKIEGVDGNSGTESMEAEAIPAESEQSSSGTAGGGFGSFGTGMGHSPSEY